MGTIIGREKSVNTLKYDPHKGGIAAIHGNRGAGCLKVAIFRLVFASFTSNMTQIMGIWRQKVRTWKSRVIRLKTSVSLRI